MNRKPVFAVLGAGNTGTCHAGALALSGFEVDLCELPSFEQNIKQIKIKGGIDVEGLFNGFAELHDVTTNLKDAVRDKDVLMICSPAYGHDAFSRAIGPYLEDGQIIVYISYFGALRMAKVLSEINVKADVTIAETLSCGYAGRRTEPTKALVMAKKEDIPVAAIPATNIDRVLEVLGKTITPMVRGTNVLETSINNYSLMVPRMVSYAGWIEASHGELPWPRPPSESVGRLNIAMDEEKMNVAAALGFKKVTKQEWSSRLYKTMPSFGELKAPPSLKNRYLVEDVQYQLVPIASIGQNLGIETPTMDALIRIASIMNDIDYWKEGANAEKLGLAGLSAKEMNELAARGTF